ncbi:MAG: HNH endonuclease [Desulfobacteraceae bacterium]|nr:HNH endonuclease [Desulfobacteraceae bacterium]
MGIFNDETIDKVWNKASKVRGLNPDLYRKDKTGKRIFKPSHGKQSDMGWEVDHSKPKAKGGTDHLNNLQALQWEENRKKSDNY